jgi:hypothetical protein
LLARSICRLASQLRVPFSVTDVVVRDQVLRELVVAMPCLGFGLGLQHVEPAAFRLHRPGDAGMDRHPQPRHLVVPAEPVNQAFSFGFAASQNRMRA